MPFFFSCLAIIAETEIKYFHREKQSYFTRNILERQTELIVVGTGLPETSLAAAL